jgi:hypothetical protein
MSTSWQHDVVHQHLVGTFPQGIVLVPTNGAFARLIARYPGAMPLSTNQLVLQATISQWGE